MGFTLRCIVGLVLVLHFSSVCSISTWERYIREAILTEAPPRPSSEKTTLDERNTTNAILPVEPLKDDSKPKTEKVNVNKVYNRNDIFTTESSRTRVKFDPFHHDDEKTEKDQDDDDHFFSSDTTYSFPSRSDSGRFIDFEFKKFTPENKNKFASPDDNDKFTYFRYFESTTEYELPHYSFFDHDHDDLIRKHDEELPDSKEEQDFSESKDTTSFDINLGGRRKNDNETKMDLDFLKLKRFDDKDSLPKKDKNSTRKNFVTEKRTSINYNSSFNKTEILDDKPDRKSNPEDDEDGYDYRSKPRHRNYESTTHKNIMYSSIMKTNNTTNRSTSDDEDEDYDINPSSDVRTIEATTHKTIIYHPTTKKSTVLTKPPALNNSHVPLLNNRIEAERIKNVDATTVRELTTRRPIRKETIKTIRVPTTRRSSLPRYTTTVRSTTTTTTTEPPTVFTTKETTTTIKSTTITQPTSTTKPTSVIGLATTTVSAIPSSNTTASSSRVTDVVPITFGAKIDEKLAPLSTSTLRNSVTSTAKNVKNITSSTTSDTPIVVSATSTTKNVKGITSTTINSSQEVPHSTLRSSGTSTAKVVTKDEAPLSVSTLRNSVSSTVKDVKGISSSTTDDLKKVPLSVSTSSSSVTKAAKEPSTTTNSTQELPLSTSSVRTATVTTNSVRSRSSSTANNSNEAPALVTTLRNSVTKDVKDVVSNTTDKEAPIIVTTFSTSVRGTTKDVKNTVTDAITTERYTSTSTTASSSTKEAVVSTTTTSEKPQIKGQKETVSYIPTKNTAINISKRGSIKFNSPTTEITRLRSTATVKTFDTTSLRPVYRNSIRNRPTPRSSTTTESEKVKLNPVFSASDVSDATATESAPAATKRESNSITLGPSIREATTEKAEATSTVSIEASSQTSTTTKTPSTTIPQNNNIRRRLTPKHSIAKIITPRYATTTTTTTTTTTNSEENTKEEFTTTEHVPEKQNVTEDYAAEETSTIGSLVTEKNINYTVNDDMETSSKYSSEIESVMNNSFIITSSTTEESTYVVTEVEETVLDTSTVSSNDTNLAPKVTEKTTTVNEDYEEEEAMEEDEKLPNQTDESEHTTHVQAPKVFDDKEEKEDEERTDNDEYTEAPYYSESDGVIETTTNFELQRPKEGNGGKIAAIVISCVGAICLIILGALLILVRKRQKRFTYGQRCTPVSLDAYSMDNVSVYNSVRRKGIIRASKRSYGNPAFEDPDSISHPLNFPALAKFATNLEDIKAEFEEIPQVTARTSELPDGCDIKNRYANVIPLPETRVFLSPIDGVPNSDYINANYVTGPKDAKRYYIACQAPLQNTIEDFWRMVWEQQTKLILMITHLFENGTEKCADYMPPSEITDCHRLFGDFQVTLKKREVKDKYIISSLQLKNMVSNSWREVTHFWYLGWPEKGVPLEANSLIAFLIEARSYVKSLIADNPTKSKSNSRNGQNSEICPIVVHCSPGTGRTGTVIACDIAIREFELSRLVDIPKIVYKIRRDRASSVQTKDQYAFIYKVISVYATKLTGGSFDSL